MRNGAAIGDAFISTTCAHHDRRIPIPGFTEYGKGDHSSVSCKNLIEVSVLGLFDEDGFVESDLAYFNRAANISSVLLVLLYIFFIIVLSQYNKQKLGFKSGVVTTSNSLDHCDMVSSTIAACPLAARKQYALRCGFALRLACYLLHYVSSYSWCDPFACVSM